MHQHSTSLSCTGPSRKCEPGCFGGARASLKHISRSAKALRARWIYVESMSTRQQLWGFDMLGRCLTNVAFSNLERGPNTSLAWRRRNSGVLQGYLNGDWLLCLCQKLSKRLWYFHARPQLLFRWNRSCFGGGLNLLHLITLGRSHLLDCWTKVDQCTARFRECSTQARLQQVMATIMVGQYISIQHDTTLCVLDRPVENFGSDLQDGIALSKLLTVIAPEAPMVVVWTGVAGAWFREAI